MKLLIISPVPTDPPTAGNRARVLNLFTALLHLGHDVTFAYVPYEHGSDDCDAMERRLRQRLCILQATPPPFPTRIGRMKRRIKRVLRLPSVHLWGVDEWFDDELLPQVKRLQSANNFEVVLIEYVFLSKLASAFPKSVRTVIDTHDLFGDRHKYYLKNKLHPTWFATTAREEIRALNRADAVIAIQDEEARYLRSHGIHEVFCAGHISTENIRPLPDPGGTRLLFVGSANPINVQGLEWFVQSVLPHIRAAIPGCVLAIAGPAGQQRTWPDGVLALGKVDSLEAAYSEATVVVNPVVFGTGLAVKSIEALSYGKALVATPAGIRGLGPEFAAAVSIAQSPHTFANQVIELLQSKEARGELTRNAIETIKRWRLRQLAALDAAVTGNKAGSAVGS